MMELQLMVFGLKNVSSVELNANKFFLPVNQHLQSHHLQLLMYYTYLPKQLM